MSLKLACLSLALAVACLGFAGGATAVSDPVAIYAPISPAAGTLSVYAPAGSKFHVRGEQPDGTYLPLMCGEVGGAEVAVVPVPRTGPSNNGQPQYIVNVRMPNGQTTVLFALPTDPLPGQDPDDLWWFD